MVKCCSENLKGWWNSFSNGYGLFSLPITSIVSTYSKPTSTSASTLPCNVGALSHTVARGNALKIMCIETRITTHLSALCSQLHHHLLRSHRRGSCTPTAHMFSHTLSGVHLCSSTGWLVYVSAYWRKIKTHTRRHKGIFRSLVGHDFLLHWCSHGCQNQYTGDVLTNNVAIYRH